MKTRTLNAIGDQVALLGVFALLVTPAIWAYQIYYWLKSGEWLSIPVSVALSSASIPKPQFTWAGVQKISDFVMNLPFSLVWFFVVLGILVLLLEWSDQLTRERTGKGARS